MSVFTYANPPVIRWGAGSVAELGGEVARLGGGPVALVTTRSVAADDRVTGPVLAALAGCQPVVTVTIGQHAPLAQVERATADVDAAGAGLVVSLGGGSPVDAAKIVARDVADRRGRERSLPHVAVPTTLSVAELASGAGFTDAAGAKAGRRDPRMLPDSVIYDGELALATPLSLWLSTGIRALDHAVESFLVPGEHPFSDVLALEAVRRLFRTLPQARERPHDAGVRTENQLAAWFSYTLTGPTAAGLSHVMGKQIGARHGIPHGVTSCLLMPHVMRFQAAGHQDRLAELSRATGSGGGALAAADDVAGLIAALDLPRHIAAYGVGEPELRTAAEELAGQRTADDLLAIYLAAL
ncbi:MAG TPA: iron-containing alcohol dehydrogenase [Terriglobales bacterium]|nr:iron-containing alcohol dehydrogenase [Terriglobales bacterium]